MTIKKSLLAVATASAVAVAGAGVASAQEDLPKTELSADGSLDNVDLSAQVGDVFGSVVTEEGKAPTWQLGAAIGALGAIVSGGGAVAGSIVLLPTLDGAIKDFQAWAGQYVG
ncbi:hypothetical protein [Corynebacterium variabile]|uniref:hypothetical protein n=1 Tax=Corynebacterium variabile TaxID=1727 RepID=UPI002647A81B|nr:hypothetical protein [Corynebacterium variabile]MDN6242194.1 hypothetical protein [Corynebacterium variabile]MDN6479027.1 hypothetical protein [Corynebacterium variabile]MDN6619605.1 hypothetical protein [Corynebacterium variabile]